MTYLFAPLDMHFDKGFGAVADSFQEAASALQDQYNRARLNGHLPICYLYRHSIELYLKASIIIVHRSLKIPYCEDKKPYDGDPYLLVGTKWKSIYLEHEISLLYRYLVSLLSQNKNWLAANTNSNWSFPDDFQSKIERIRDLDSKSAYFRYPTEKSSAYEKEKSAFKETSVDQVMEQAIKDKEPMKTMMTIDLLGRPKQIFVHDDSFTEETMKMLSDVAEVLSSCHFGLMQQLGGSGLSF